MTVAEMLGRISSRELSEWMAYYEMQGSKDYKKRFTAESAERAESNINQREKTPQEIYQMMRTWAVLHGG